MNHQASKLKGLVWVAVGCFVGAAFACGLAPLAHAIPWSWEKKLAWTLDSTPLQKGCSNNAFARASFEKLVKRIYPVLPDDGDFSIDVQVVDNEQVNAYAELGGRITVNSGLIAQAEWPEELAGVLAHEIEHVHHRHIMQGTIEHLFTAQGFNLIFGDTSTGDWSRYFLTMSFSREQEEQADEGGLERLSKAHVNNAGFRRFFERMEQSEHVPPFLSDHPSSHSRAEMTRGFDNRDTTPIMPDAEWLVLKHHCGVK